ncbi:FTR1 family iron permease [Cardiobacterium valvarum]|uniref:Iron permease FTR1 family protein n=1 Tax=Cardiobacterium valvarum F0432 TaxID=797473 RepID=G9ZEH4_9GAMM|nr:FTR1 family protein [Cardiobacterium valvarum]EHM54607.1 iron permease FTR1 family protein [Cardiobacterium valvarum F0432]
MTSLRHLLLPLFFLCCLPVFAQDYRAFAEDIATRLDATNELYQADKVDEAKEKVQMAYFEVFENLEGPIRINISAKKSADMEAEFGSIRRMISQGEAKDAVAARLQALRDEVRAVVPTLESGHKLVAHGAHSALEGIDPGWAAAYQAIDDNLAAAVSAFEKKNPAEAKARVQQAQYDGFKNSDMETTIRMQKSARAAEVINREFAALMKQAESDDNISSFGYSVTTLLDDVQEALQDVPAPVTAAAADDAAATADSGKDWTAVRGELFTALGGAKAAYQAGDTKKAVSQVQDAYFDIFEASGMENAIGARDTAFKTELEGHFTKLVGLMNAGKGEAAIQAEITTFSVNMDKAMEMLGGSTTGFALFIASLTIILREGLEALLIVAAVIAYIHKSGHGDKQKIITGSVWWALAASVVTALLFKWLLANAAAGREILEGVTMLIATVMLFGMSYWLLSKVEAQHWKAYLEKKIGTSLSQGSLIGLWLTSFLAVYREGAETVLFYFALAAEAKTAPDYGYLAGGFAVGVVILAVIYLIMRYSVVRLPLKPFFMFTGIFMYLMAFIFAGKGVAELIEGKAFTPTLIGEGTAIPAWMTNWLGMAPYWETLLPQIVLLFAALFALWVLFIRKPKESSNRS